MVVVSSSFDCRRLLQCVRRTDRLEEDPPQMLAHAVASSLLLVVAYTKHAMAAQLFPMQEEEEVAETAVSVSADPLEIVWGGDIAVDDDAILSCAAIVEAPHAATTTHRSNSSSSITSTASLLQGVLSMDEDENGDGRERDSITLSPTLALLVGTTDGRLGAVPLFLQDATLTQGPAQWVVPPPEGLLSNGGGVQSITIRKQEVILVYNHASVRHLPVARCFVTTQAATLGCYRRLRPPSGSRCLPRLLILPPHPHQRSPLQDVLAPQQPSAPEEQVLVYYPSSGGGLDAALLPTWAWYSAPSAGVEQPPVHSHLSPAAPEVVTPPDNANDDDDDDDGILFVSLTKALVGSAVGALRWGGRPKSAKAASEDPHITSAAETPPLDYTLTAAWHDAPRTIEQATVDPVTGHWIAMADSLGRILLVERSTRQIVRLWKGFRDASCHWLVPKAGGPLCLVIHSRQRRRIEVWRVRHGGRVLALAVGRDAQVLPVSGGTAAAAPCLWTAAPHRLEWMQVPPTAAAEAPSTVPRTKAPLRSAGRLKHLQQLLSLRPVTLSDVRAAVCDISAPVDLATALDVCATASVLDHAAGIQQGSSFQKEVLAHCRSVLNARGMDPAGRTNSHLLLTLQHKLEYHEKVRGNRRDCSMYFII